MDALTFEKIIRNHEYVLVKFDTAYPFGDLHDEWKDVARYSARNFDLIAAEVNINEYGHGFEQASIVSEFLSIESNTISGIFVKFLKCL